MRRSIPYVRLTALLILLPVFPVHAESLYREAPVAESGTIKW